MLGTLLHVVKDFFFYNGSSACLRLTGGMNEWFGINEGVVQSCVMTPESFNVLIDVR